MRDPVITAFREVFGKGFALEVQRRIPLVTTTNEVIRMPTLPSVIAWFVVKVEPIEGVNPH
jgi:hypothetical protein